MRIVCLLSLYKEGTLSRAAVQSALDTGCPVIVAEGPAGPPLPDDLPTSEIPAGVTHTLHGRWPSDAAKRIALVREAQRRYPGPLWAVWVDGDELLCNARYLPDVLAAVAAQDEHEGNPDEPVAGYPILKVEQDGSLAVCLGNVLRIDLVDEYLVSSSIVRMRNGATLEIGNLPHDGGKWLSDRAQAMSEGKLFLPPPLPCEPFLLHRSHLRHPLRRGLRLHEAERVELAKLGYDV